MAKLKPSEYRLLLVFAILAFVLANVFGYTWLQKQHNSVKSERIELKSKLQQAENYALQEEDSLQKEEWLMKRVPVYRSEDEMKTFLIKFVRQKAASFGIEAEFHSQEPVIEGGYMRSRLEVKRVSGSVETLVQWVFSLLDPEQFRTITSLEFSAKPRDPTTVFCELVIEQWWNLNSLEIAANSEVPPMAPAGGVEPAPAPASGPVPDDAPAPGGLPPGVLPQDVSQPVIEPPAPQEPSKKI